MTPYSAAAGGSFSSRASSRRAARSTSSGRVSSSRRARSSLISACWSSTSPSSCWIALSCWRRKYSRWPFSISDWTLRLDPGTELEDLQLAVEDRGDSAQPFLHVRQLEQLLLLLGLDPERRGDEVAQRARVVDVRGGQLQLFREVGDEADDPGEEALDVARERLDLGRVGEDVRNVLEVADEVSSVALRSTIRMRRIPWTRTRGVPSGTRISLWTLAAVPISYRSSQSGSSASELRTVTSASSRSAPTMSSTSRIERSWPIASGVIESGNTTVSFSGRTGSSVIR